MTETQNFLLVDGLEWGPFSAEELADMAISARRMVVVER